MEVALQAWVTPGGGVTRCREMDAPYCLVRLLFWPSSRARESGAFAVAFSCHPREGGDPRLRSHFRFRNIRSVASCRGHRPAGDMPRRGIRALLLLSTVIPAKAGIHVCDRTSVFGTSEAWLHAGATGLPGVCAAAWTSAPLPQAGARIRSRANLPQGAARCRAGDHAGARRARCIPPTVRRPSHRGAPCFGCLKTANRKSSAAPMGEHTLLARHCRARLRTPGALRRAGRTAKRRAARVSHGWLTAPPGNPRFGGNPV